MAANGRAVKGEDSLEDLQARVHEVESLFSPSQKPNEIGRLAHYRVLRLLGAGGMGVVYQAEDTQLERLVALKILRPSLGSSARKRFMREARAAAAIDHDHVVTIFTVGSEGPLAYLAMQWLNGESLEDRLKREGKLPHDDVVQIGCQIAQGLSAAHAKMLIHRDIKPANVWLEAGRGRARILDFGLAQVLNDNAELTETGMIAGTPAYMSPEQAQGRLVDERSDLFSLGTMLYRMLTGELPFGTPNALATIRAIQVETPESPRQMDISTPVSLSDTVMALLEKEPRSRPENARQVVEYLKQEKRAPKPTMVAQSSIRGSRFTKILTLLLAFTGFLAAPFIYRIATDNGQLVVRTADPNVKIEVSKGGELVRVIDPITDDVVTLRAGTYDLKAVGGHSKVKLSQNRLVLVRDGKEEVSIEHIDEVAERTIDASEEELRQFALQHISGDSLASECKKYLGEDLKITHDERSILVSAPRDSMERLAKIVELLDVPPPPDEYSQAFVLSLRYVDAERMLELLKDLGSTDELHIKVAGPKRLFMHGQGTLVQLVKGFVAELDVEDAVVPQETISNRKHPEPGGTAEGSGPQGEARSWQGGRDTEIELRGELVSTTVRSEASHTRYVPRMVVESKEDDRVIRSLSAGQQCTVVFDAFPNNTYEGLLSGVLVPPTEAFGKSQHEIAISLDSWPDNVKKKLTATVTFKIGSDSQLQSGTQLGDESDSTNNN